MAPYNFIPTVEENGISSWLITAPRKLREKLWDSLNNARDMVNLEGMNYTQIVVKSLPGYTRDQSYIIAVGHLYVPTSTFQPSWDLDEFWTRSLQNHAASLSTLIVKPAGEPFSIDDLETALSIWIPNEATRQLKHATKNHGFQTGVLYNWWQQAVKARTRLLFTGSNLAMDEATRKQYLDETLDMVNKLEASYRRCVDLDHTIDERKTEAESIVLSFQSFATTSTSLSDLYRFWLGCLGELSALDKIMSNYQKSFDEKAAQDTLQAIRMITPPELSEKKS